MLLIFTQEHSVLVNKVDRSIGGRDPAGTRGPGASRAGTAASPGRLYDGTRSTGVLAVLCTCATYGVIEGTGNRLEKERQLEKTKERRRIGISAEAPCLCRTTALGVQTHV